MTSSVYIVLLIILDLFRESHSAGLPGRRLSVLIYAQSVFISQSIRIDAGLLLSVTADTVIRLVPPLILTVAEADEIVARLVPLIKTFLAEQA